MNRKAQLPGWAIIVSLIIGLVVIAALVYLAIKSKGTLLDKLDFLRGFF